MAPHNFPLFQPAIEHPPEVSSPTVSDLVDREVRRAALIGPDPYRDVRKTITSDLPQEAITALQALANATGTSRRALGSRLLKAAIWQAVDELARHGKGTQSLPEYEAVFELFTEAFNDLSAVKK